MRTRTTKQRLVMATMLAASMVVTATSSGAVTTKKKAKKVATTTTQKRSATPTSTAASTSITAAAAAGSVEKLPTAARLAEVMKRAGWGSNVTLTVGADSASFASNGLPNHEYLSSYLGKNDTGKYVASGAKSFTSKQTIPLVPTKLASSQKTNMGATGVSISGALFFNPFEGGNDTTTYAMEDNSYIGSVPFIDPCNGHPVPNGTQYHYHGVPVCVSKAIDRAGEHSHMVGYLLDGYPIYGPQDVGGKAPNNLDDCLGHYGPTPEFPEGIYHYHTMTTKPYVPNCYHGKVTVSSGPGAGGPPPQG